MKLSSNKFKSAIICSVLCLGILSGCTPKAEQPKQDNSVTTEARQEEAESVSLPIEQPLELMFASGAGGWSTDITLNSDGYFEGIYHDSDMGDAGTEYPNGTVYICKFNGQFEDIKKIDDNFYSMTLNGMNITTGNESEWIEDGIRYIPSEPYGMESGKEYIFYTPKTPVEGLSKGFISWWPDWMYSNNGTPDTLSCYGLYNKELGYGFFTYDYDN